jgi:hypothetical protein
LKFGAGRSSLGISLALQIAKSVQKIEFFFRQHPAAALKCNGGYFMVKVKRFRLRRAQTIGEIH